MEQKQRAWQKLLALFFPNRRQPRLCEGCNRPFACGASLKGCWCFGASLTDETRKELRARYKDCVCRECLQGASMKDQK